MPKYTWVLLQVETENGRRVFVGNLPWEQFTDDPNRAKRFKDRRDAENHVTDYCRDWPHQPTPVFLELDQ